MSKDLKSLDQSIRRTALLFTCGLLAVAGLYVEEAVHYKHTLYGIKEHYVTRDQDNHPECVNRDGNPLELICPMPGYNSIRLACEGAQCVPEDQDALPMTPERLAEYRLRMLAEFGRMPRQAHTWADVPREDTPEEIRQQRLKEERQIQTYPQQQPAQQQLQPQASR